MKGSDRRRCRHDLGQPPHRPAGYSSQQDAVAADDARHHHRRRGGDRRGVDRAGPQLRHRDPVRRGRRDLHDGGPAPGPAGPRSRRTRGHPDLRRRVGDHGTRHRTQVLQPDLLPRRIDQGRQPPILDDSARGRPLPSGGLESLGRPGAVLLRSRSPAIGESVHGRPGGHRRARARRAHPRHRPDRRLVRLHHRRHHGVPGRDAGPEPGRLCPHPHHHRPRHLRGRSLQAAPSGLPGGEPRNRRPGPRPDAGDPARSPPVAGRDEG